jgi:hypothetical protein
LEEVAVRVGRKVLMEVDDNILLIVSDPQGILDQQLRPHPSHLLKITINILNYLSLNYFQKLRTTLFEGGNGYTFCSV